ncbi:hypothetical protein BDA96_03G175600 [Sorghum bicolor]|uniref:J domain-containing protein n=1 Tax=Sorghum bicolor TaxID=4558 RepID=A0A921UQ99_SORBI|nr:hypothetical protein BDA96_03G175600 [Sorghum bicolor]
MAGRGGGGSKSSSLYAVLGVASDCSDADLRNTYRKLAMVSDLLRFICFPLSCQAALFRSKIPTLLLCSLVCNSPCWCWWAEMAPRQVRWELRRQHERGQGQVSEDPGSLRR